MVCNAVLRATIPASQETSTTVATIPYRSINHPAVRRPTTTVLLMADKTLDTTGMNCPLPILKTRKAIGEVPAGGTLEVLATDPGSVADMEAFCKYQRHELIEQTETGGVYRFLIRRGG
ncbi:MAG TPA: sulfurtransferase TusA family protein [Hyphomicrobiaceae bacterium]|nr:sulfurtransferase TusA family protein [Hyphomicrobiaceae bacterium]